MTAGPVRRWNGRRLDAYPSRVRIMRFLLQTGGSTLNDLRAETHLSRSALRQHLTLLERDGLIQEQLARGGMGRPPIVYQLTREARQLVRATTAAQAGSGGRGV